MGVSIKDLDNDNASFSEGTLTDVVAVNDSLELANNPALSFDGVDDYVDLGLDISDNGTFTVEFNFKDLSSGAAFRRWFTTTTAAFTDNTFVVRETSGGEIYLKSGAFDATTSGYAWKGNNNHYAAVSDGTTCKLYENGNLLLETSGTLTDAENGAYIGGHYNNTGEFAKGKFDEVRIWNTAKTQTEIQNNMNKELTGTETGLVAYYKMNEGSGTTLTNSAGTNDGTIYGASWTVDTTRYLTTGNRQSPQLDLSAVNDVASSSISWTETLNTQTITIETSVDGGSTWQTATNGGAIPNLPANPTTLDVSQTLDTSDTTVTPVLNSLTVDIDTAEGNTDSGSLAEGETYTFYPFQFTDSGSITDTEESNLAGFTFNDSGSFNIDAENWYTMVWELFTESSLKENIEHDLDGWIQNPKGTSQWQSVDENTQDLWTKVDKNTADWNKG